MPVRGLFHVKQNTLGRNTHGRPGPRPFSDTTMQRRPLAVSQAAARKAWRTRKRSQRDAERMKLDDGGQIIDRLLTVEARAESVTALAQGAPAQDGTAALASRSRSS
jgi:hypothetical protein